MLIDAEVLNEDQLRHFLDEQKKTGMKLGKLLIQQGIHIMEMVMTNDLAKDKAYEFCFITLPNKIKGATGSMIRPIAVI